MSRRRSIVWSFSVVVVVAVSLGAFVAAWSHRGAAKGSTISADQHARPELLVPRPCPMTVADWPEPPSAGPVHVVRWKGDRRAALSFTFDDGIADQATLAAPMLEAEGFRGTFFICPARAERAQNATTIPSSGTVDPPIYASWDQWKQVAARGHEIGSHTWDHLPLDKVDSRTRLKEEIVRSCEVIEQQTGRPCVSFSYPFNIDSAESRSLIRHTYLFAVGGERVWYGGFHFRAITADQALDRTIAARGWQVAMIHAIEHGYGAFHNRDVLRQHLDYVKSHADEVWVEPLGTVGRYQREVQSVKLTLLTREERSVRFIMTAPPRDPPDFDVPITIAIDAAATGAVAYASGRSDPISLSIKSDRILIDLLPGPTSVDVTWN